MMNPGLRRFFSLQSLISLSKSPPPASSPKTVPTFSQKSPPKALPPLGELSNADGPAYTHSSPHPSPSSSRAPSPALALSPQPDLPYHLTSQTLCRSYHRLSYLQTPGQEEEAMEALGQAVQTFLDHAQDNKPTPNHLARHPVKNTPKENEDVKATRLEDQLSIWRKDPSPKNTSTLSHMINQTWQESKSDPAKRDELLTCLYPLGYSNTRDLRFLSTLNNPELKTWINSQFKALPDKAPDMIEEYLRRNKQPALKKAINAHVGDLLNIAQKKPAQSSKEKRIHAGQELIDLRNFLVQKEKKVLKDIIEDIFDATTQKNLAGFMAACNKWEQEKSARPH